jgi:hypothetical protein
MPIATCRAEKSPIENLKKRYLPNAYSITLEMSGPNTEGMGWRVAISIITFFGAIIGIILWLFFYAGSFNVYQNIAVIAVILLAFVAVMGGTWAPWGMKQAAWRDDNKKRGSNPSQDGP